MTSIALPRITPTTYPLSQLFTDISTALPFCLERTEEAFRRVTINKLDEQGNIRPIRKFRYDENGIRQEYQVWEETFIEDVRTGEVYWNETTSVVREKCATILLVTPIYTLGVMEWHLYQLVRCIGIVAVNIFNAIRESSGASDALQNAYREIEVLPSVFAERFLAIVSAPLFGLGIEMAALFGLFKPLHGRKFEAMIEKAWHHGVSFKEDMRHDEVAEPRTLSNECERLHSGREFYMAYCYQVRGNTSSPRIRVVRRENLQ